MKSTLLGTLAVLTLGFTTPVWAEAVIGAPAPAIAAKDIKGNDVTLEMYKGKPIVLEWTNHECPFVRKHYDSRNMQDLQKYAADRGVMWITIVSSAPEKQGHVTPEKAAQILLDEGAIVGHKILDADGTLGHLYEAKATPHMFVIDANGVLAYKGAIDSNSSPNPSTISGATNYVRAALDELAAGKPVTAPTTEAYGCAVKY